MREEARMYRQSARIYKQQMRMYRHHMRGYRRPPQGSGVGVFLFLAFILPLVLMMLSARSEFWPGMIATAMSWPLLFAAGVGVVVSRHARRRQALRRGGAPGTAPLPARPAAPPRPDKVWAGARQRFHALRAEYAAFECNTMEVLRLPALADVTVPSTARFIDAFAEAQALETDAFPQDPHAGQFVAAADKAERAWRAARDAADRIRLSNLTPAERSTVERVIKLLTTARDSDSDPERLAAYAKARSELAKLDRAGVIHLPTPAQAALDTAAQGALPPAKETA